MKRREKCGHEKRCENKRKDLRTAAAAPGQRSIVDMFNARATPGPRPTSRPIGSSEQQQMEDQIDMEVQMSNISNQEKVYQAKIDGSKEELESLEIVNNELTTQPSAPQQSQQPSTSSVSRIDVELLLEVFFPKGEDT
eukprot:gene864-10613_t